MNQSITIEELMAEMQRLEKQQPDGLTSAEMGALLKWSQQMVIAKLLRPLMAAGRIVSGVRRTTAISGRAAQVPVYMLRRTDDAKAKTDPGQDRRKQMDRKTRKAKKRLR